MATLLSKLQYKGEPEIVLHNVPADVVAALQDGHSDALPIVMDLPAEGDLQFMLAFIHDHADAAKICALVNGRIGSSTKLWLAYVKKSSKKYAGVISRDQGWEAFGAIGLEGVRQVAIDSDWSAVRFRSIDDIRSFTRDASRSISKGGQMRAKNK